MPARGFRKRRTLDSPNCECQRRTRQRSLSGDVLGRSPGSRAGTIRQHHGRVGCIDQPYDAMDVYSFATRADLERSWRTARPAWDELAQAERHMVAAQSSALVVTDSVVIFDDRSDGRLPHTHQSDSRMRVVKPGLPRTATCRPDMPKSVIRRLRNSRTKPPDPQVLTISPRKAELIPKQTCVF